MFVINKMKKTILFISHPKKQCGVYEFGKNIFNAIKVSLKYNFIWLEINSLEELFGGINKNNPEVIIYNYHPATMPWIYTKIAPRLYQNNIHKVPVIQIGIIHEVTQAIADQATNYKNRVIFGTSNKLANSLFDFYIAPDPTLLLRNPCVYKTGRLVPDYKNDYQTPETFTAGSFGFGTPKKGFEKIVLKVQDEFDEAIIRFNIPSADFGDPNGLNAKQIAANCKALVTKKGIQLNITHDFLNDEQVLYFLSQNTINIFLYEELKARGLSSAIDNALAVKRPLAVSNSSMFRHILNTVPSVCAENNSLKQIAHSGFDPLQRLNDDWNASNISWEYDRILDAVVKRSLINTLPVGGLIRKLKSKVRRLSSLPDKSFTWLRDTDKATEDSLDVNPQLKYTPIILSSADQLNRILDNTARSLYAPAVTKLFEAVPKTMSKKIAEANVQQGFVFDTAYRYLQEQKNKDTKILCVGSYEDTASMSLRKMGFSVEEIDPMINYYLQEYITKPTTIKNSYNLIFSTSVIEHDPKDELFVSCINKLLAPGGVAVITCDYKDGWKQGDLKPEVDERFYTQEDLSVRLLRHMPDCNLVDTPKWDCPNPDFFYLGKHNYTFATLVVRKNNV